MSSVCRTIQLLPFNCRDFFNAKSQLFLALKYSDNLKDVSASSHVPLGQEGSLHARSQRLSVLSSWNVDLLFKHQTVGVQLTQLN